MIIVFVALISLPLSSSYCASSSVLKNQGIRLSAAVNTGGGGSLEALGNPKLTPLQKAILKIGVDIFGYEDEFKTSREQLESFSRLSTPIDKFLALDRFAPLLPVFILDLTINIDNVSPAAPRYRDSRLPGDDALMDEDSLRRTAMPSWPPSLSASTGGKREVAR